MMSSNTNKNKLFIEAMSLTSKETAGQTNKQSKKLNKCFIFNKSFLYSVLDNNKKRVSKGLSD